MSSDPISITRRALFTTGGLIASSFALPRVPGQEGVCKLIGATPAAAEEKTDTFTVDIASESTIQIKVFDVASAGMDATSPGVAGAAITVTPLDVDAPATTLMTNENGFAVIDLKGYCKEVFEDFPRYMCNVMIDIYLEGHRKVKMLKMCAIGSRIYTLPCPKIEKGEENDPYFRAIAFDGWDVQYNVATFMYSTVNSAALTLTVQARTSVDPNKVKVEFWRWHTDNPVQSNLPEFKDKKGLMRLLGYMNLGEEGEVCSDDKEFREVTLKGPFLLDNSNQAFASENDRFVVRLVADGSYTYKVITYAQFKRMPFNGTQTGDFGFLPSLKTDSLAFDCGKIPGIGDDGNMEFSIGFPRWRVLFAYVPQGYGILGLQLPAQWIGKWPGSGGEMRRLPNENFKAATKTFVNFSLGRIKEVAELKGGTWAQTVYNKINNKVNPEGAEGGNAGGNAGGDAAGGDAGNAGGDAAGAQEQPLDANAPLADNANDRNAQRLRWRFLPRLWIQIAIQGYGDIEWNGTRLGGGINFQAAATLSQTVNWYLMIGWFPVYIMLGIDLNGGIGGRAGWSFPFEEGFDFGTAFLNFWRDATFDVQGSKIALTIGGAASVGAGLGIQDVFTGGGRGSIGFSLYFGLFDGSTYTQGVGPTPFRFETYWSFTIFFQVWMFKYTMTWSGKLSKYDSTDDSKTKAAFRTMPNASELSSLIQDSIASGGSTLEGALPDEYRLLSEDQISLVSEDGSSGMTVDPNVGLTFAQLAELASSPYDGGTVICASVTQDTLESTNELTLEATEGYMSEAGDDDTMPPQPLKVESQANKGQGFSSIVRTFGTTGSSRNEETMSLADTGDEDVFDPTAIPVRALISQSADPGYTVLESKPKLYEGGAGVSSLSGVSDDGVKCNASKFLEHVYSDGRPKFAHVSSVEGKGDAKGSAQKTRLAMFRMASVKYGEKSRQRLVVQYKKDDGTWTDPSAIDFTLQGIYYNGEPVTRFGLNDYDFDVCEFTYKPSAAYGNNVRQLERRYVAIMLLSGIMDDEKEDDFNLDDIATKPVTSVLIFGQRYSDSGSGIDAPVDDNGKFEFSPVARDAVSWMTFENATAYGKKKFVTYSPTIAAHVCEDGKSLAQTLVVSGGYVYRETEETDDNAIFQDVVHSNVRIFSASMDVMPKAGWSKEDPEPDCDAFSNFLKVDGLTLGDAGLDAQSVSLGAMKGSTQIEEGNTGTWTVTSDTFFGFTVKRDVDTTDGTAKKDAGVQTGVFAVHSTRTYPQGPTSRSLAMQGDVESDNAVTTKVEAKVVMDLDANLKNIVNWRAHEGMLALKSVGTGEEERKELHHILLPDAWDGAAQDAGLIGPAKDTPVEFMFNETGDMLIYADGAYNKHMPVVDENGSGSLVEDSDGNECIKTERVADKYTIKAMNAVYDKDAKKTLFSKPYTLADLGETPVDGVVAAAAGSGTTDMVVMHVTNAMNSEAEYLLVRIPCVTCLTPQSITVADNYALAGEECTFRIAFQNDGNTIITGAKIYLLDATDGKDTEIEGLKDIDIVLSKDTVIDSDDMIPDAEVGTVTSDVKFETGYENDSDHLLGKDGGRTVLAPGAGARIEVKVTIPKDWSGSRKLKVKASEITYLNPITNETATVKTVEETKQSGGSASGSDIISSFLKWHCGISCSGMGDDGDWTKKESVGEDKTDVTVKFETLWDTGSIADLGNSKDRIERADGSTSGGDNDGSAGSNAGGGSSAGSSSGSGKSGKAGMPDTGDAGGLAGVASLAAGALGAGMLAYSKRRQMVAAEEATAAAAKSDAASEDDAE